MAELLMGHFEEGDAEGDEDDEEDDPSFAPAEGEAGDEELTPRELVRAACSACCPAAACVRGCTACCGGCSLPESVHGLQFVEHAPLYLTSDLDFMVRRCLFRSIRDSVGTPGLHQQMTALAPF